MGNHFFSEKYYNVQPLGETVSIDITSKELIWNNFSPKNRNVIRNAINNGLLLIEQPDLYDEVSEGDILDEILSQGKHKNQSFFAFTATPKNKTLEAFGTVNPTNGKKEPFHIQTEKNRFWTGLFKS